jgi:hypothetical protein
MNMGCSGPSSVSHRRATSRVVRRPVGDQRSPACLQILQLWCTAPRDQLGQQTDRSCLTRLAAALAHTGAVQAQLAEQRTQPERLVILDAPLPAARRAGRLGGQKRRCLLLHESPLDLAEKLLPLGEARPGCSSRSCCLARTSRSSALSEPSSATLTSWILSGRASGSAAADDANTTTATSVRSAPRSIRISMPPKRPANCC